MATPPSLEDAIILATQAHVGQMDKVGQPYIFHPIRVMLRVSDPSARMVAILHDVVEDTSVTLDDLIRGGFPPEVVEAVDLVSRRDDETYEQFIERLAPNPIARAVKLADLEDNMDPSRLPAITERTLERLERYRKARARLWELEGGPAPDDLGPGRAG
jgi:(p)ppGpp synthase/HD superfamily hydrolase